jgi:hypothetical protein
MMFFLLQKAATSKIIFALMIAGLALQIVAVSFVAAHIIPAFLKDPDFISRGSEMIERNQIAAESRALAREDLQAAEDAFKADFEERQLEARSYFAEAEAMQADIKDKIARNEDDSDSDDLEEQRALIEQRIAEIRAGAPGADK